MIANVGLTEARLSPAENTGLDQGHAVIIEGAAFSGSSSLSLDDPRRTASQRIATDVASRVDATIVPEVKELLAADAERKVNPGRTINESAAMAAILAEREVADNPNVALLGAAERGQLLRQAKDLAEIAARGVAGAEEEKARQKEQEKTGNADPLGLKQSLGVGQTLTQEEQLAALSQPRINAQATEELAGLKIPENHDLRNDITQKYPGLTSILEAVRAAAEASGLTQREAEPMLATTEAASHSSTFEEALARHTREESVSQTSGPEVRGPLSGIIRIEDLYKQAQILTAGRHAEENPVVARAIEDRQQLLAA